MPADWYLPSSGTATLTVGLAKGDVTGFRVIAAAEQGDLIGTSVDPFEITVHNVGTVSGTINLRVRDRDGSTIWTGSVILAVGDWKRIYPAPSYPMPARDLRLRAEAYHDSVVDDYMDKTVVLITKINTATTLTLEPATIEPGGTYRYKGKLTRIDTGAGLGGMEIISRRYEAGTWLDVGSGTTDANGNYNISVVAPIDIAEYNCLAAFPGIVPFEASSAQASLGVGIIPVQVIWALIAASVGTGLVVASRM